jgi:hypothetical protein
MNRILIVIVVLMAFNLFAQNENGKRIEIDLKPVLRETKLSQLKYDPRISMPIYLTVISTIVFAVGGYGIGYLEGISDSPGYRPIHGLRGMMIGAPIGFCGGLTFGIIQGQYEYKKYNSPDETNQE